MQAPNSELQYNPQDPRNTEGLPVLNRLKFMLILPVMAILMLAVSPSTSNPLAQGKVKAKKQRVSKSALAAAKKTAKKIKKRDRTTYNALRYLLNRPQDANRMPFWRLNEALPGLGFYKPDSGEAYPKWLSLRLAAVIRGGFPINLNLKNELKTFFDTPTKTSIDTPSVLVELMVCDAIAHRSDEAALSFHKDAKSRADRIRSTAKWSEGKFAKPPTTAQLSAWVSELAARLIYQNNQWKTPKGNAIARGQSLVAFTLKNPQGTGMLWHGIDGGYNTTQPDKSVKRFFRDKERAHGILILAVAHSLASRLRVEDQDEVDISKIAKIMQTHSGTLTKANAKTEYDKLAQGGAAAILTGEIEDSLLRFKDEKKTVKNRSKSIRGAALLNPLHLYQLPDPQDMGFAQLMGWETVAQRQAAGAATKFAMDDRALRTSMALIAREGGLVADKIHESRYDAELIKDALSAITTLELGDTPATFEDRVNRAVTRAAEHFLEIQESDGSFPGQYKDYPGGQALFVLALLDAGISRDASAIKKGISFCRSKSSMRAPTYAAGIILMMLQKFYEKEQEKAGMLTVTGKEDFAQAQKKMWKSLPGVDRKWIKDLVTLLTKHHYAGEGWGYSRSNKEAHKDNSNSQYAILGLKAASLLGAKFDRKVFKLEADRFIKDYWLSSTPQIKVRRRETAKKKKEGGTDTKKPKIKDITPGGWGYIGGKNNSRTLQMSAAGVSSLMICRDELKLAGKLPRALDDNIWRHVVGAMYHMGSNYAYQRPKSLTQLRARSDGFGTFYDMYSVERAGVLSGMELLNTVRWYLEGANILIDGQMPDGHWPIMAGGAKYETVNHAFAILFLKRAAIHIADPPKRDKKPITGK